MATRITTKTDLRTWVGSVRPDYVEHGLADELVDALQDADHPAWGSDWEEWLASSEVEEIAADVAAIAADAREAVREMGEIDD